MATNNKSTIPPNNIPLDVRMARIRSFHRPYATSMPKSSLSYPMVPQLPDKQPQKKSRYLYVVKTPTHRIISSRTPTPQPSQTQQPNPPRPYTQYGHFLAYLRRQSLARMRRKQEEEEGNTDHIETTITLNLNKQSSIQSFQSTSSYSLASLTSDTTSMPMISMTAKRAGRPSSSLQRSMTNYRLNAYPKSPSPVMKASIDDQLVPLTSSSLLTTPRNSVVDDMTIPPIKIPYDLNFNDDLMNYNNGIKYRGRTLSTAV